MNYKILLLVFVLLAAGSFSASAGERRFTTYYPSPSGEYRETRVKETLTIPEKEVGEDIDKVTAGEIWFEKKDDCGLRGFDGSQIVHFACEEGTPKSRFRVTTPSGETRGIVLVDIGQSGASRFRIRYNEAGGAPVIKALGHMSPGISISSCEELQMIGYHKSYPIDANYYLKNDIDCAATNPSNSDYATSLWGKGYAARFPDGWDGEPKSGDESISALALNQLGTYGFKPLGLLDKIIYTGGSERHFDSSPFKGLFDGKGKSIKNLYMRRPSPNYITSKLGLFESSISATFQNIRFSNIHVEGSPGDGITGSLVAYCVGINTNIRNCHLDGGILIGGTAGGLIGSINSSHLEISDCSANAHTVRGCSIGGLVGVSLGSNFSNCHSNGTIGGKESVRTSHLGGLVGIFLGGTLNQCSASGYISPFHNSASTWDVMYVGGLVGVINYDVTVNECYSTVEINGDGYNGDGKAGGLIGFSDSDSKYIKKIKNCYVASPSISYPNTNTRAWLGGLYGGNYAGEKIEIENSYSTATVSSKYSRYRAGGFVGLIAGSPISISSCFSTGVAVNNPPTAGGFVADEYGLTGSYSNNFWYNDTNVYDVGTIDKPGITKAGSISDFYGTGSGLGKDVYKTWNFTNVWKSRPGKYPCLRWDTENCK